MNKKYLEQIENIKKIIENHKTAIQAVCKTFYHKEITHIKIFNMQMTYGKNNILNIILDIHFITEDKHIIIEDCLLQYDKNTNQLYWENLIEKLIKNIA